MNYNKFYDAVAAEYGPEVALAAISRTGEGVSYVAAA